MSSVRAVLSRRNFQRFLAARLISNFGNGMGTIALAFGILHMRGGSATELGIVVGSTSLAYLIVSPLVVLSPIAMGVFEWLRSPIPGAALSY